MPARLLRLLFVSSLGALALVACREAEPAPPADGGDGGGAPACEVEAPTACPSPAPTYLDVEPVLSEYCVECHWGEPDGPWPLTSYPHVASWQPEIRGVMLDCSMPPVDADLNMPTEARELLLQWLRCDAPE